MRCNLQRDSRGTKLKVLVASVFSLEVPADQREQDARIADDHSALECRLADVGIGGV
jgi:hypothetical protein